MVRVSKSERNVILKKKKGLYSSKRIEEGEAVVGVRFLILRVLARRWIEGSSIYHPGFNKLGQ